MNAKSSLEKEALIAYRNRWQSVTELEAGERRSTTFTERWQQLNALLQIARSLDLSITRGQESELQYQNWQKIRLIYLNRLDQAS